MPHSLDGIKKTKIYKKKLSKPKFFGFDGIKRPKFISVASFLPSFAHTVLPEFLKPQKPVYFRLLQSRTAPVFLSVLLLFLAFLGGVWSSLHTAQLKAEQEENQPQISKGEPIVLGAVSSSADEGSDNSVLFNTPLELLQEYFTVKAEAAKLQQRTEKIGAFLRDKKSPLAEQAEVIAQQEHWKLILAIAFAESTLGKRCFNNNCSGIGVAPGHPAWRKYASVRHWILDFNRLLEKRYKDKTLKQMCGVYVKPCNPNWLLAAKQIFGEIKDRGIE